MRRFQLVLTIFLFTVLILGGCAKKIELTKDNYRDYLSINVYYLVINY